MKYEWNYDVLLTSRKIHVFQSNTLLLDYLLLWITDIERKTGFLR